MFMRNVEVSVSLTESGSFGSDAVTCLVIVSTQLVIFFSSFFV